LGQRLVVEGGNSAELESTAAAFGWQGAGDLAGLGLHSIGTGQTGPPSPELLATLAILPSDSEVELDGRARPPEACDLFSPYSVQQCTIGFLDGSAGEQTFSSQDWLAELGIENVQAHAKSAPTFVAVIDSGLDLAHPVFEGRLASHGWDFVLGRARAMDIPNGVDEDNDGFVDEAFGHGTHVASLIALTDPNALLLPYRVVDADGRGWAFDVAQAIVMATMDGADVINLSLSVEPDSGALRSALEFALAMGVEVYSSAGNTSGPGVLFPANLENEPLPYFLGWIPPTFIGVVAVAATDSGGSLADFSAYGDEVDIAAPGVDMYGALPGGMWGWWSGTSMATAVASGSASLLRSTSWLSFLVQSDQLMIANSVELPSSGGHGKHIGELNFGILDVSAAFAANFIP